MKSFVLLGIGQSSKMRQREEKRRKLHEALLQTLYPPPSSPSPSSSPSEVEEYKEPFDVTLINPEDYVNIDSPHESEELETIETEKASRAQRKRVRKKMLKEEAVRRRKVIGPLLPLDMIQTSVAHASGEEQASFSQPVRLNVLETEEKSGANDKTKRVKKRREAKKLAKASSKPNSAPDPNSQTS